MKQVVQRLKDGSIQVVEVPVPSVEPGFVLIRVAASVVSAGTERVAIEFARQNLLEKARAKPHLAQQVLEKVLRDGLLATARLVRDRLRVHWRRCGRPACSTSSWWNKASSGQS